MRVPHISTLHAMKIAVTLGNLALAAALVLASACGTTHWGLGPYASDTEGSGNGDADVGASDVDDTDVDAWTADAADAADGVPDSQVDDTGARDAADADTRDTGDADAIVTTASFPVVETDQNGCFGVVQPIECPGSAGSFFGQDAHYETTPTDYRDNGDGTVTDLVTGLMWQQTPGEKMVWADADAGAETFELAGYDDWRLPTIKELYSLMNFDGRDPSGGGEGDIAVPFLNTEFFDFSYGDPDAGERLIDAQYATSTAYVGQAMGAHAVFGVNFADGRIKGYPDGTEGGRALAFFIRYVRGPAGYGEGEFADTGDGTVFDATTGLTWQQADDGIARGWADALAYCEALELAGADDWRLPDVKELHTLVDYGRSPATTGSAAIDPVFEATGITNEAGDADFGCYWSSTTHAASNGTGGWGAYVAFGRAMGYFDGRWQDVHGAGAQRSDPKVADPEDYPEGFGPQGDAIRVSNFARCVRGGATPADPDSWDIPDGSGEGSGVPDGPPRCESQADCETGLNCPPDADLGCSCDALPSDGMGCVPICETDDDCPAVPLDTLACNGAGRCAPVR